MDRIYDDDPDLLQNRAEPLFDRALVISAGVIANVVLVWVAIFSSISVVGISAYDVKPQALVSTIFDVSGPAVRDGLKASDVMLSLNDLPVGASLDSAAQVAEKIRSSNGKALNLSVLRDDEPLSVSIRSKCCLPDGSSSVGDTNLVYN